MQRTVKILPLQSMADIAIQEYGKLEGVIKMAFDNAIGMTDDLVPGSQLHLKSEPVESRPVYYYQEQGIKPATGGSVEKPGGIGYMGIEIDFIVS